MSAACLLVFLIRNSEKQDCLQPKVMSAGRLVDDFVERKLKYAGHTRDRPSLLDLFADEQRQNEIVCREIGLPDQIA